MGVFHFFAGADRLSRVCGGDGRNVRLRIFAVFKICRKCFFSSPGGFFFKIRLHFIRFWVKFFCTFFLFAHTSDHLKGFPT